MATCPKCNGNVPYLKLMGHTRWTPIVCPHCDSRLHFDKRDWTRKAGTFALLLLLLSIICLVGVLIMSSYVYVAVMALVGPILIVKFSLDIRNIKLQEKQTRALFNKSTGSDS